MTTTMPRWGWVNAQPHEFLVQIRRGEPIRGQQGGSCFKWPTDTVALVDTSLARLQFTADQVTLEKTGVQVTGLAVFRVVAPLIAYRMLDLTGAACHLDILEQMLSGATRRLVANLSLEDCLTRRKDALSTELLAEIAPVVAGSGHPDDTTAGGWGIAIDTIEVQDVRVLSEEVFSRLQAPYREALQLDALRAQDEVAREEARLAHDAAQVAEARRTDQLAAEQTRRDTEHRRAIEDAQHHAEVERRQQEIALVTRAEGLQAEIESARIRATAASEAQTEASRARRGIAEAEAASRLKVAELEAAAERVVGEAQADVARMTRAAHDEVSDARLREVALTQTLPEVARAYADSFDRIVVTGASDLSILGQGVGQVVATAQALGIPLGAGSGG